ncbi:tyrosine-protein kinase Fer [Phoenix dactylifera]|uniref:non-specific serine/threonine protein kinase n=1 Tax=Phoenix dactylifera TaxID=42345 RepID=A0A8B8ZFM7_PHODC|nr:tyrosine-protein kinase Fer [Phoenix dactylifera]
MEKEPEALVKRLQELEASQARLREQLDVVRREREVETKHQVRPVITSRGGSEAGFLPGFFAGNPYRNVLHCMGHALHVCRPGTGEIIYWSVSLLINVCLGLLNPRGNGKELISILCAGIGRPKISMDGRIAKHLAEGLPICSFDEESRPYLQKAMERLSNGRSWSGQFPLKKRSGEMFVALVTQSPLYEDGEFIGIITVSCDAALLYDTSSEKSRVRWDQAQAQIASSVSSLAAKIAPRNHVRSVSAGRNSLERCECMFENQNVKSEKTEIPALKAIFRSRAGKRAVEEMTHKYEETISKFNQPSKTVAKVFGKLKFEEAPTKFKNQIKAFKLIQQRIQPPIRQKRKENHINQQQWGISPVPVVVTVMHQREGQTIVHKPIDEAKSQNMKIAEFGASGFPNVLRETVPGQTNHGSHERVECSAKSNSFQEMGTGFPRGKDVNSNCKQEYYAASVEQSGKKDDVSHEQENPKQDLAAHSTLQNTDASTTGEKDWNLVVDCDIQWEDLLLGEEIGEGSYAIVYRGVWNGSDVAIKLYLQKDYHEGALLDFKEEIRIMKILRHPNVLLFMGAVYSPDRLAIVTEFLPRGSLFRVLHKNNQALDFKRRLKMAFDVARGMNYLHRRNPPIIHRDLKSSNLLVDKNWTVKVGDFGLSCLKSSSTLTAKSGKGTPQWMAPEVLRGECSNEMSDVFSFGVILWELMTESVPWSHLNSLQVAGVVGFMDRRLDLPEGLDTRVASIICNCWESDPGRRPTFQQIMETMAELTTAPAHRMREHSTGGAPSNG